MKYMTHEKENKRLQRTEYDANPHEYGIEAFRREETIESLRDRLSVAPDLTRDSYTNRNERDANEEDGSLPPPAYEKNNTNAFLSAAADDAAATTTTATSLSRNNTSFAASETMSSCTFRSTSSLLREPSSAYLLKDERAASAKAYAAFPVALASNSASAPAPLLPPLTGSPHAALDYPIIVIRSIATNALMKVGADGAMTQQQRRELRRSVGEESPVAEPWELFTLRPHPRIQPKGKFFMIRSEAYSLNLSAIQVAGINAMDGAAAHTNHASPRVNPHFSDGNAFRAISPAAEWCGFEFLPVEDVYTEALVTATLGHSAATMPYLASAGGGIASAVPIPNGTYAISPYATGARLAFIAPDAFGAVSAVDFRVSALSPIIVERVPPEKVIGRQNIYTLQSPTSKLYVGLEKARFYCCPIAQGWEHWEILPHPELPHHHSIRSIAFNRYLCIDPSVSSSNGMVLRTADKPAPWEAFYFGHANVIV